MVCGHDSGNVYYKAEYKQANPSREWGLIILAPFVVFRAVIARQHRYCDALETGNRGAEYRATTPLEIRLTNRWYQRGKTPLMRHAECSENVIR